MSTKTNTNFDYVLLVPRRYTQWCTCCRHTQTHIHSLVLSSDASVIEQINNDHNHVQHCDERRKKSTNMWFHLFRNGTTLRSFDAMIMAHYCLTRYTINFRSAFPTNSHYMQCNPLLLLSVSFSGIKCISARALVSPQCVYKSVWASHSLLQMHVILYNTVRSFSRFDTFALLLMLLLLLLLLL